MFCLRQIPFIFKISAFFILLSMSFSGFAVNAADVVLTWDRPIDSRVTGYKIFYGTADTDFKSIPKQIIDSPARTSCDIFDLKAGNTYGFAAKSFDEKGNESIFSDVLYYDVSDTQDGRSSVNKGGNVDGGGGGGGCLIHSSRF